jgi:hypothetical protein
LGREVLIAEAAANRSVRVIDPSPTPLDTVFLTMIGGNHRIASVEMVLGRALLARGHKIRYVLCDGMLPVCEAKLQGQEHRWSEICANCYEFGKRYFG